MKLQFLMRFLSIIALSLLLVLCVFSQKPTKKVSVENKAEIEKIVREYILKNPSIIREAIELLQAQEVQQKQALITANLKKLNSDIYLDKDSPIAGNPNGDVTVVTFFDYNCGYCKMSLPTLKTLIEQDSAVKIIYKELPILGTDSFLAAQAALAAKRQGKYEQFHQGLMDSKLVNENTIKAVAKQLEINYETLAKDMADPKLQAELTRNLQLATALNIDGTPAYIVGDEIIPGAINLEGLTYKISFQRARQKANSGKSSGVQKK